MKTIHIYSNGSPIHSKVIGFLLEQSTADEDIVINSRGMRFESSRPLTEFACPDEEYLNGRRFIKEVFDHIERRHGRDFRIHLFINHTNYLLPKIHHVLGMGTYSYIEDGTGTYAALIDAERGTRLFASALAADITSPRKASGLAARWRDAMAVPLRRAGRALAVGTWNVWRMLSINLFAVTVRRQENYFDFQDRAYRNIFLTTPRFGRFRSVQVPLDVTPPADRKPGTYLVLIPPRKLISDPYFFAFAGSLKAMRERHPDRVFHYKSHPSDSGDVDYRTLMADGAPAGDLIRLSGNGETAILAFQEGYAGIVCFDSSAALYALTFLPPARFECIDLSSEITGRQGFSVQVAMELQRCWAVQAGGNGQ